MQYRSFADMNNTIMRHRAQLPATIDLVVGIPRSGLVAANFLSIATNAPLTDLAGLIEGRVFEAGSTKVRPDFERALSPDRTVVVIDDTISSGRSFLAAKQRIINAGLSGRFIYCAVFGEFEKYPEIDIVMEPVGPPTICEWNIMHTPILTHTCVDIDGVLCENCPSQDDDDGERYLAFLKQAKPLLKPTREIGWLVTERKEMYREETVNWLKENGINYQKLIMRDQKHQHLTHEAFKGEIYKKTPAVLFIESELDQSQEISSISGKPVLSIETQHLLNPALGIGSISQSIKVMPIYTRNNWGGVRNGSFAGIKHRMRMLLGDRMYQLMKRIIKGKNELGTGNS